MTGIQRLQKTFANGNKTFIAYLTAGDGGIQHTLNAARALIAGGINMLEIGVPFSDPIADGKVIQRAAERALAAQTTMENIFWLATEIRKCSDIPLILFTYYNPLLALQNENFFYELKQAGMDGVLLVDCPLEESKTFNQQMLSQQLAPIYVITSSTPIERIRKIDRCGKGFLYYACRKGTTGMRADLPADFNATMQTIKASVKLPVVAGFGISTFATAETVLKEADGVVVGSLFVKALEDGISMPELTQLAMSINPLRKK